MIGDFDNAALALEKYRELDCKDEADHLNILALSLVSRKMYSVAEVYLEKSVSLLEKEISSKTPQKEKKETNPNAFKTLFIKEEEDNLLLEEKLQRVYKNIAYVYSKTGKYEKSHQFYSKIENRDSNFEILLSVSNVYFLQKDIENCVSFSLKAFEICKEEKEKVYVLTNLSKTCYQLGDLQSSKKYAILAIQKFPEVKEGWYCAATLSLLTRDFNITTKALSKIYQIENSTASTRYNLFSSYLAHLNGNRNLSKSFIQKSIHLDPQSTELWLDFCEHQINDPSKNSDNVYLLVSNLFPLFNNYFSQKKIPSIPFKLLSLSYLSIGNNQYIGSTESTLNRSKSLIHKLLIFNPLDDYLWLLLSFYSYHIALLSNRSQDWISSQKILRQVIEQNNSIFWNEKKVLQTEILFFCYSALSETHFHLFQYKESESEIEKLEKILSEEKKDQKDENLKSNLLWQKSKIHFFKKEFKESVSLLEKSISINPKNFFASIDLANFYFSSGDLEKSKTSFESLLSQNDFSSDLNKFIEISVRLSCVYFQLNDFKKSLQILLDCGKQKTSFSSSIFFLQAICLIHLKNWKQAEYKLKRVLSVNPSQPLLSYYLSSHFFFLKFLFNILIFFFKKGVYNGLKDIENELNELNKEKCSVLGCTNSQLYFDLGNFYLSTKEKQLAKSHFQKAIMLDPSLEHYWDNINQKK